MTTPELLTQSGKFKTFDDILLNYSLIVDLAAEDVEKMLAQKGKIINEGFDEFYRAAAAKFSKTMQRLTKNNERLKGIQRILDFCTDDKIKNAIAKVVSRISGQTENELNPNRKNSLAWQKKNLCYELEMVDEKAIDLTEDELSRMSRTTLIVGLADLWEREMFNPDFDIEDMKYLCIKCNVDLYDVVNEIELETPKMGIETNENGNSQSVFIFD